jgi:drug/metabolite transporter (DMT)-like permease
MGHMNTPEKIRKDQLDGLAVGILLVCCMFWGFQQVLVKATVAELPPVFQSAVRGAGAWPATFWPLPARTEATPT